MDNNFFYHGGVTEDFNIDSIDVYRPSIKQGSKYAGFYMYKDDNRDKAFHYAEQTNSFFNTSDRGVVKIEMDSNLNIFYLDRMFEIDRLTINQLQYYANLGYDLISGNSFGGQQYVLLNKDKIKSISFESMDKRYEDTIKMI